MKFVINLMTATIKFESILSEIIPPLTPKKRIPFFSFADLYYQQIGLNYYYLILIFID